MRRSLSALALLAVSTLSISAPLDDARALLARGDAAGATVLLEKSLDQHLLDVDYNYLMGIALLDAGKPGDAIFAFERVLAIEPGNALARAELARAMIALTEYDAARVELEQVRRGAIPASVAARVEAILAELDRAIAAKSLSSGAAVFSGYIEGEFGYDSNINTAPNSNSVVIPLFGLPASLTGFARSQESWLVGLNGGFSVQKRISDGVDVYAGVDIRARYHPDQNDYTPVALAVGGGVRLTRGMDQFSLGASQFTYYIGQFRNDDQQSVYGQWQRQLDRLNVVGAFAQYVRASHPIAPLLNTNLYLLGGTWTRSLETSGDPRVTLTAWVADDRERGSIPTAGRNFLGAKVALDYKLQEKLRLFGSVAVQASRYGGRSVFFGVPRKDDRYDMNVGVSYRTDKFWTYSAQLTHTKNQSNIAINDFSRDLLVVTARREF